MPADTIVLSAPRPANGIKMWTSPLPSVQLHKYQGTCSGGPQTHASSAGARVCPTKASPVPFRARPSSSTGADPGVMHGAWCAGGSQVSPAVQSTVACTLGGRDCILLSSVLIPCCGSDSPCLPACSFSGNVAASFSSCQAERSVSPAFPLSPAPCPPQGCRAPGPGCSSFSSNGFQQAGSRGSGCAAFAQCSGPCLVLMF